LLGQVKDLYY